MLPRWNIRCQGGGVALAGSAAHWSSRLGSLRRPWCYPGRALRPLFTRHGPRSMTRSANLWREYPCCWSRLQPSADTGRIWVLRSGPVWTGSTRRVWWQCTGLAVISRELDVLRLQQILLWTSPHPAMGLKDSKDVAATASSDSYFVAARWMLTSTSWRRRVDGPIRTPVRC